MIDFDQPRYGEITLSIDNKKWTRHLYIDYELITHGDVTVFYNLTQEKELQDGDGFPDCFFDVKER